MHARTLLPIAIGFIFLALGAVGVFIPIWPTTPFVLISAACFSRAPALRDSIMRISFFREHYDNYKTRRGLTKKTVAISLGYLWATLVLSIILSAKPAITILLTAVGVAVTVHILLMARSKR